MQNPFELIEKRLDSIEGLLKGLLMADKVVDEDILGDIDFACEITKLKKPTIYSHVHLQKIPFHKKLGKLYFSKKELQQWLIEPEVKKPLFPKTKNNYIN